ncbi:glycosyltransferase family 1 protein [Plicaturopsis crispa FD-325 SS-3]|nr:glycosyltransferase family 1 protein [Plicaturopsis crispa FD-325 SS-3]
MSYLFLVVLLCALSACRIYSILRRPSAHRSKRSKSEACSLGVFLGSGGHTSEALTLLSTLDFARYSPRTYVVSEGDKLSAQKALELESQKSAGEKNHTTSNGYRILTIPRARRVHQSLVTTPPTALLSLLSCLYHVTFAPLMSPQSWRSPFVDVLILNGPGTCFVLCAAVFVNRVLGLPSPKLIYIESFARVRSLSLSGKLLRPFVDRFIVQWPQTIKDGGRGECYGWLV